MKTLLLAAAVAVASGAMPVAQQNELVRKYCAVCHTDAHPNGGLTLQHFDAAHADPGDAAMMLSKLKTGAIGAAGVPQPDKATIEAWISAMSDEAAGANEWIVTKKAGIKTASIVRETPSTAKEAIVGDLYRLTLTCRADTHQTEMQLAWSPGTPKSGQVFSVEVGGKAPLRFKVEGSEKMGNGTGGSSGPGAMVLTGAPMPAQSLTISNVFPDEKIVFPFAGLTLGGC